MKKKKKNKKVSFVKDVTLNVEDVCVCVYGDRAPTSCGCR